MIFKPMLLCYRFNSDEFAINYVQAAFLGFRIFPPPASGTHILSRLDRTGARLAADRRIAFVVQEIIWNLVAPDIVPDVIFRPVG